MLDFMRIGTRSTKRGVIEIHPKFIIGKSRDLMIRGGDFYAVWVEERGLWSTDEDDAIHMIDSELDTYAKENRARFDGEVRVLHMRDAESGMIDIFHKYCQRQMRDNFHMLDENLIFMNTQTGKKDYASKRLEYPLEEGPIDAWDRMMSVLYSPEERMKIEWAIGAVVSGASKHIQKFMVLYGSAGTGKSTVLNVIGQLFEGYTSVFDAKALGSSSNAFALEAFKRNPLVAIQHDGDLSRIEDNTRLNSLVSHELMTVNEKFKSSYENRFKAFLFMGTNKPVKITDAKSGLIRRLIDVTPTGNKLEPKEYRKVTGLIPFELGHIAYHCREVYMDNPGRYDDYIPTSMLGASNDFYNFVMDSFYIFKRDDATTLKAAWEMYKTYCEEAKVSYPYPKRAFKEELKNYFREYHERANVSADDGLRSRNVYIGFRRDKFETEEKPGEKNEENAPWLTMRRQESILDRERADQKAQYANEDGSPRRKWDNVTTTLSEIDTGKLHYVKMPQSHIVIDFDICGRDGKKDREANLREAGKWPATYAEMSKSGCGVHLHYIYTGDAAKLSRIYDDKIEVKIFTGNSSLRRMLTLCNDLPIASISSGLPLREEKKVVNFDTIKSEKALRTLIKRNLKKEYHGATKPSVDFIFKILEDAHKSGMPYDVSDMQGAVISFAAGSTHQAETCLKLVTQMKWKSEEPSLTWIPQKEEEEEKLVFYDVEVFPNLLLVNWKVEGEGKQVIRMINPSPQEIEELMRCRLVGFNCRRYDNHILYARLLGYDNEQIYQISQGIISGERNCFFGEAYNASYTDVYDFLSKKQSLKKWEIELGIHHKELGLPWDQPVPEEKWIEVAEYCDNDVIATEAVFNARKSDFTARKILADIAGMTVNDTTNSLTARIIFGGEKKPQGGFNYRDMGDESAIEMRGTYNGLDEYTAFDAQGRPIFPGYRYSYGKSSYRDVSEVGEGGYVYAEPGIYRNVALLDIASMHPASIIAEQLFGEYTKRFEELREVRIAIKHKEFDRARQMMDGKLVKYLTDEESAKELSLALKIPINMVYGMTSAGFDNPFRDERNKDNIVAKRGALFMINLRHEVQKRGYTVAHVKTDSIKIPEATKEIIDFVFEYGKMYGYDFEHEATYERMCLVNNAVYIARYNEAHKDKKTGEEIWWTATGTQFQVPYVFKTLFSRKPIEFDDMCETKSVSTALYLDMNEGLEEGEHDYHFIGKVGRFCPMKKGAGGGSLMRESTSKKTGETTYAAATGSKGYRWMESEMVRTLGLEGQIERGYYDEMVNEAIAEIGKYGDAEAFISVD